MKHVTREVREEIVAKIETLGWVGMTPEGKARKERILKQNFFV